MNDVSVGRQLYGRRIRQLRAEANMSQRDLAEVVRCAAAYISQIEKGVRLPEKTMAECLDTTLDAHGSLLEDWQLLDSSRKQGSTVSDSGPITNAGDEEDDVERRQAIQALAALGVGAGSLDALERVRYLVDAHLDPQAEQSLDEWGYAPLEYAESLKHRAPSAVQHDLALDLVELDKLTTRPNVALDTRQKLLRCSALLAGLMAMLSVRQQEQRQARRWWNTAQTAAARAEDIETWTWVRAQEAVMGLYSGWSPARVVSVADDVVDRPGVAWRAQAGALAARAQASAQLGRKDEALHALHELARHTGSIPSQYEGTTSLQWSEFRTRHTESYVHTFLGHTEEAMESRQRFYELSAYLPNQTRLVRLHEAASVLQQDLTEGSMAMNELLTEHPDGQMVALARTLVQTIGPTDTHACALPAYRQVRATLELPT